MNLKQLRNELARFQEELEEDMDFETVETLEVTDKTGRPFTFVKLFTSLRTLTKKVEIHS